VGWQEAGAGDDAFILRSPAEGGHSAVVEFLVSEVKIPFVEAVGAPGHTAIHAACRFGHSATVATLLRLGLPWRCRWYRPCYSLSRAVYSYFWPGDAVCRFLITPLGDAVLSGSLSCVRLLLDRCEGDVSSPNVIVLAAMCGHVDVLRLLLRKLPHCDHDEALMIARVLGHSACASLLVGARFRLSPHLMRR
jgi:ankyrin repeat protein